MNGRGTRYRCRRPASLSVFSFLVVLLGLVGKVGANDEEEHDGSAKLLRRRRASNTDNHNPYWDLPGEGDLATDADTDTTSSPSSTSSNDDYWQLPDDEDDDEPLIEISSHVEVLYASVNEKEVNSSATNSTQDREDNTSADTIDTNTDSNDNNEDLQSDLLSMTQDIYVDQCLTLLESHAVNRRVNRHIYVDFLLELSKNSLQATEFQELPLFLSMIFFSSACTSGEDCVTQEPAITMHPRGSHENRLNNLLCVQLMRFPFLEIMMPFQFLVRVSSEVTASQVLYVNETNQVVPMLESALDQALLHGFNCSYVPREPVPLRREKKSAKKRKQDMKDRSQRRQPQPQHDCDFVVEVRVEDAADYPCGLDNSCILIFSDVSVFAVLNESLDEPTLRSLTTNVLRDAINGDELNVFIR